MPIYSTRPWLLTVTAMTLASSAYPARGADSPQSQVQPPPLRRPIDPGQPGVSPAAPPTVSPVTPPAANPAPIPAPETTLEDFVIPTGFAGRSGVLPQEATPDPDGNFVPAEDRWRDGWPVWDRYDKGHPPVDDYPYVPGHFWDPYNLNVVKGDYPIIGQHTFLNLSGSSVSLFEFRQLPTATTPFESTANAFQTDFFGKPNSFLYQQYFRLSADLFHGDGVFKPVDWRLKLTPIFNVNYLAAEELGVVNPNVTAGTTRGRTYAALEEWFLEAKLADLSPDYDFVSVRAGSQPFTSDFRGFIFSDVNRAVRLFGNSFSNRDQFNLLYFSMLEKDTNSGLNTLNYRGQQVVIANYYVQDFIWPGYTVQASFHYNHDNPSFKFNKNEFLVRPDPVGVFQPHSLDVYYLGWAGNGHINRVNVTHAFYWALGHDSLNPIANQSQDISAQMAAAELSYDRDYVRFRGSLLWASGDGNVNNKHATGFDSILDSPNFAGGEFSFWQRQAIPLFGVNLVNRESLLPDLRSSKTQGQSNFVNPGLFLVNVGVDVDVTPKIKMINNVNFLWFDKTNSLETFVFQRRVDRAIGSDLSTGFEYRPLLSNNVILTLGASALIPGQGFKDLYNMLGTNVHPLTAAFVEMTLNF